MIKYQRNNITFRIASADAIAKFKSAQAHSFVQLSRKELNFDEAAKETVLLEFDRLSQWIFRVERICLSSGDGKISDQLQIAIVHSLEDEFSVIENVIESNFGVFTANSIAFTKVIHRYSLDILRNYLIKCMSENVIYAYTSMVKIIASYLQHLLVSMHEFDANLVKKAPTPFVCSSDFGVDYGTDDASRFLSCISRALFFKEKGLGHTFVLKNYSQQDIYSAAKNYFASVGFNIVPEQGELIESP